jgi:hypothetical protein
MVPSDLDSQRHGTNPRRTSVEQRQGHGGHVVKANDLHPVSMSAKPRCSRSCSGEDAGGPESPANSREVS